MSMDFSGRESDKPITDQEGVMFAAQPVWERSRKRKGFGARKAAAPAGSVTTEPVTTTIAPEPRTFAAERDYDEPMALDTPVNRPVATALAEGSYARSEYATMNPSATTNSTLAAEPVVETDGGLVAPIGVGRSTRSTRSKSSGGVAPAAIAAGVVALGALGATGWYMSRGDTSGVPELTPGSASTSQVAAAPLAPTDPPAQMAANTAAPPPAATTPAAAEPARASTPARSTARARPAQASSADGTGVNASATTTALPDGPQPYSSASPSAAPAEPPVINLPPASAAPAAVPSTPPTVTPEPAPTPAPAQATPPTTTPPQ